MSQADNDRYNAVALLRLRASAQQSQTLESIAAWIDPSKPLNQPIRLARRAICASLGAGNWREVAAEAAQRLSEGSL